MRAAGRGIAVGGFGLLGVALAGPAFAEGAPGAEGNEAGFALVVGVNRGIDTDSAPLRYADDDAVRFQTLFRTVGMTTYTLARLDDNTRRLHPGVVGEVAAPRLLELRKVVDRLRADVARARAAGKKTVFYLAYAGHGKADGGNGYLMLEDARLRGPDLLGEIIDPVRAEATHVVVDACYSFSAVIGRGPGGTRRPLEGFSQLGIGQRPDVGVLLSTSSARESHEWSAFQAGVFSHEVRSGLYGAADADGNGLVSYLEIASFVDRANVSVPNEQFRPQPFARPPAGGATLLDLRPALGVRIEVDSPRPGHHYLEDPAGVRWADFHNAGNLRLLRPVAARLYLRRAAGDREQVVPEGVGVVRTSQLPEQDSHVAARGAAHDLFRSLFELPFSPEAITSYAARDSNRRADLTAARERPLPAGQVAALAIGAGGLAAAAAGAVVLMTAHTLRGDVQPDSSQREIEAINARIAGRNRWGVALVAAGGAAAVLGSATLWLLQGTPASHVEVAVTPGGWTAGLRGSF
jgi:hypothetical protein